MLGKLVDYSNSTLLLFSSQHPLLRAAQVLEHSPVPLKTTSALPANTTTVANNKQQDPYEFVAFLLWYIFLVLCCIVPTCCAYRRRRLMERRIAEEHASQLQQANLIFNIGQARQFHANQQINEETMQKERSQLLTEALLPSTMTVSECNLKEVEGAPKRELSSSIASHRQLNGRSTAGREGAGSNRNKEESEIVVPSSTDPRASAHKSVGDWDLTDLELDLESNMVLLLPPRLSNLGRNDESDNDDELKSIEKPDCEGLSREVAGTCAICLCPYEVGDQVTWAANQSSICPHAFHTNCIIGWLSKKTDPKCPVCRQCFCQAVVLNTQPTFRGTILLDEVPFPFTRGLMEVVAVPGISIFEPGSIRSLHRQPVLAVSTTSNNNNVLEDGIITNRNEQELPRLSTQQVGIPWSRSQRDPPTPLAS